MQPSKGLLSPPVLDGSFGSGLPAGALTQPGGSNAACCTFTGPAPSGAAQERTKGHVYRPRLGRFTIVSKKKKRKRNKWREKFLLNDTWQKSYIAAIVLTCSTSQRAHKTSRGIRTSPGLSATPRAAGLEQVEQSRNVHVLPFWISQYLPEKTSNVWEFQSHVV